jgi:hypothetical protein
MEWRRSLGTNTWSISSAIYDLLKSSALSRPFKPKQIFGDISTSFGRPLSSSVAAGVARTKASGVVPVGVHGCSKMCSFYLLITVYPILLPGQKQRRSVFKKVSTYGKTNLSNVVVSTTGCGMPSA